MADVTAIGWFPVLTLLIGYGTKSLSDWFQHRRTREREREARDAVRRDQLFERRTSFQRQTLLDLQQALMQLARATGAAHHLDTMAYHQTGKWQKQLLENELSESFRVGQATTSMFGVRVRDKSVRDMVQSFKACATNAVQSGTKESSELAMVNMGAVFEQLNQRIGELLRELDDDEIAKS